MKVDVIYRCCGKEMSGERRERRPPWFDKRKCFKSVWQMSEYAPSEFTTHVIYDGPDSSLLQYFKTKRIDGGIHCVNLGHNQSVSLQWDYADKLTGDWIYFVEDDYLHAPDAGRVFLEGTKFALFTLYDHLDRYTRTDDLTLGTEQVAMTPSCHWRTAESTCVTWAVSRSMWPRISGVAHKHGNNDRSFFRELIAAGVRLWTPIPGRSTHCMEGYMTPLVDWEKIAKAIEL